MQERQEGEPLIPGQAKSAVGGAMDVNGAQSMALTMQTGSFSDMPPQIAYDAQVGDAFTSTPGLVGYGDGGSAASGSGGLNSGASGANGVYAGKFMKTSPDDVLPAPTANISAPAVTSNAAVSRPAPMSASAGTHHLINHERLNAYRQMRGLPPLPLPLPQFRGIGGAVAARGPGTGTATPGGGTTGAPLTPTTARGIDYHARARGGDVLSMIHNRPNGPPEMPLPRGIGGALLGAFR